MSLELLLGLSGFIVFVLILVIMHSNNPEVMKQKIKKQLETEGKNFVERRKNATEFKEKDFIVPLAKFFKATPEKTINYGLRPDFISKSYVYEVEYAHNYHMCLGQPLFYAYHSGKEPVCVVLVAGEKDERHLKKLLPTLDRYGVLHYIVDVDLDTGEWSFRSDE